MEPDQKLVKSQKEREAIGPPLLDLSMVIMMDEQIWKEFPEDLLEGVIARLPIVAFFRFRLVCLEWNSLLKSHSFLQRCEEVAQVDKPWFFYKTSTYDGAEAGAMYDTCTKKWHVYPACTQSIYPLASIGGLVCCVDVKNKCFMMGNPVTQIWKKFMKFIRSDQARSVGYAVGMVMCSGGYKIVTVNRWGEFEVYDSMMENSTSSASPTTTGKFPNFISPIIITKKSYSVHFELTHPVTIGTVVYFLVSYPDGILSYDTVSGALEKVDIPIPPDSSNLSLAESGGRILLVGLVRDENAGPLSVRVWELQRTMLAWTEVDRMPESWCSDMSHHKEVYLRCMGKTRILMMSLQMLGMDRLFTYDLVTREWSEVPHFVADGGRRTLRSRNRRDCGVGFFPRLSAAP